MFRQVHSVVNALTLQGLLQTVSVQVTETGTHFSVKAHCEAAEVLRESNAQSKTRVKTRPAWLPSPCNLSKPLRCGESAARGKASPEVEGADVEVGGIIVNLPA